MNNNQIDSYMIQRGASAGDKQYNVQGRCSDAASDGIGQVKLSVYTVQYIAAKGDGMGLLTRLESHGIHLSHIR